jgi:hypothetical protein
MGKNVDKVAPREGEEGKDWCVVMRRGGKYGFVARIPRGVE